MDSITISVKKSTIKKFFKSFILILLILAVALNLYYKYGRGYYFFSAWLCYLRYSGFYQVHWGVRTTTDLIFELACIVGVYFSFNAIRFKNFKTKRAIRIFCLVTLWLFFCIGDIVVLYANSVDVFDLNKSLVSVNPFLTALSYFVAILVSNLLYNIIKNKTFKVIERME